MEAICSVEMPEMRYPVTSAVSQKTLVCRPQNLQVKLRLFPTPTVLDNHSASEIYVIYFFSSFQLYEKYKSEFEETLVKKTDSLMKEIEAIFPRLAVLDMMDDADNIREYLGVSLINLLTKF